jgi:hypothetical protein
MSLAIFRVNRPDRHLHGDFLEETSTQRKTIRTGECFDDEGFLQFRPTYVECEQEMASPSEAGEWASPTCSLDAQSSSLVVDYFLSGMRETLEEDGRIKDLKAITLEGDGLGKILSFCQRCVQD